MVTSSQDHLADVFRHVEIHGVISGGFTASGPWVSCGEVTDAVKIVAVLRGRAHLRTDGGASTTLLAGDVALLSHRSWLALRGGSPQETAREIPPPVGWSGWPESLPDTAERADTVVGGHVQLGPTGRALLYPGLPSVNHIHGTAPAARRLRAVLGLLLEEASGSQAGSRFAVARYAQLLALEALRASAGRTDLPPGWLRLLADERLRPAVQLMHNDPGRPWQLEHLARAAMMSRTAFAERFRRTSGLTPFAYLHRWRMILAEHALRHGDTSVNALSARLGYASPSTFSTAFRRTAGVSPSAYRRARAAPTPQEL